MLNNSQQKPSESKIKKDLIENLISKNQVLNEKAAVHCEGCVSVVFP